MSMMDLLTVVNSDPMTPLNEGGVKIVKSVQRGISTGAGMTVSGEGQTITISEVDPNKCLVLINGTVYYNENTHSWHHAVLSSLKSTSLTVASSMTTNNAGNYSARFSWQVIEFY